MTNNLNVAKTPITSLLEDLRVPDTYSTTVGGIKLPIKPTFGKLSRSRFSRTNSSEEYKALLFFFEDKNTGETYIVTPSMAPYLGSMVQAKILRLAVDNAAVPYLIAEPVIDPNGRPSLWNSSMVEAIRRSLKEWVRINSNQNAGQYEIIIAQDNLGEPKWPEQTMDELIREVFGNKIISSLDHPLIRQLQGRI
jgi:hypothetical protein